MDGVDAEVVSDTDGWLWRCCTVVLTHQKRTYIAVKKTKVELTFPSRVRVSIPMGFIGDGDDTSTTSDELVIENGHHGKAVWESRNVVRGDVVKEGTSSEVTW